MRPSRLTPMNPVLPRIEPRHIVIGECNPPSCSVGLKEPLRQILIATRHIWDVPSSRESVRENFRKVIDCRTTALGGEIYASDNETLIVPHTCKSRSCSSCGHRATLLWQRDRWCDLLDAHTPWSRSRCLMFYGQSSAPIATFFVTCRQSAPR